ncbi:hypothetical protein L6164_037100 [Bauhinia variegata]|uniref:Uncharacterized protein n=1 Tax=Bauhinia variegata TaxID=167791 RepID=A0ACB9KIX7_BAUVA|nr:hypothetical protein L6164_037100 [Bauhinia variegata]
MVSASEFEAETKKPQVAVLSSPGMGHVIPLFVMAKGLVTQHGLHVSFLNVTTEASAAQYQLLHSPDLPSGLEIVDLPMVDLSNLVDGNTPVLTRLSLNVQESFRCLKTLLVNLNPNLLIIDLFCTQAFDVCNELSIPVYTFFTPPTHLLAFSLFLPKLDRDVEGEFVDLPEPVQVPGCSSIRTEDLLDQVRNRKIDEYKWFLYHLSRVKMAAGIFLNTWEDLEPVSIRAIRDLPFYQQIPTPTVYPVGPIIKETEPMTEECGAWLDQQPSDSVLYIALGSGGTLTSEQQIELAWGLEMSKQRFIWVVRMPSDACASASFFNVGSDPNDPESYLPEGFLERTRETGLVVPSWAPQVAILEHASIGAFLSHCGWNSILESLANGVPIIGWPLYAEQRMNATMLAEDVGVGIKAVGGRESGSVIGRNEIAKVVRKTMEGEEGKVLRAKARELKESASKALEVGGSSYQSLAILANQWKAKFTI